MHHIASSSYDGAFYKINLVGTLVVIARQHASLLGSRQPAVVASVETIYLFFMREKKMLRQEKFVAKKNINYVPKIYVYDFALLKLYNYENCLDLKRAIKTFSLIFTYY
jgi:hypothetical protein